MNLIDALQFAIDELDLRSDESGKDPDHTPEQIKKIQSDCTHAIEHLLDLLNFFNAVDKE